MRRFILVFTVTSLAGLWHNNASADDWTPLWSTANLSQARYNLAATSAGNQVFFGGGGNWAGTKSNVVDIYNTSTNTWTAATLSVSRSFPAAASAGNEVLFGGGTLINNGNPSNVVDVYNTSTNTWSAATLPHAGGTLVASSAGGKIFFAGFSNTPFSSWSPSNILDIYNTSTNTWATATLPRAYGTSVAISSAGDNVFFGGGYVGSGGGAISNIVDIYNTSTNTWSSVNLPGALTPTVATSAGNQVFFATSGMLDVYNTSTNTAIAAYCPVGFSPTMAASVATSSGVLAFFTNGYRVDIYNASTNTWSIASLSLVRSGIAETSAGNKVFFAGGYNSNTDSSVVDIYTLQTYGTITSSQAFTLVDQTTVTSRMQLNSPGSINLSAFNLVAGSMNGNAPINLGGNTLTVGSDNSMDATYTGVISGNGALVKVGNGLQTLSANNTYSGGTSITSGTLSLSASLSPASPIAVTGGVLDLGGLNQTTSAAVSFRGGGVQNGMITATGTAYDAQAGIISANLAGSVGLTKSGSGTITLSGSNTYTGGTTINQGTLNVTGKLTGGNVLIAGGATLTGSGSVNSSIAGSIGSSITATGNFSLGDSNSYTGFSHAGTLTVGNNTVILGSKQFANLGISTTLSGGTLNALNGISLAAGCVLSGSGTVNGAVAAGIGSTIEATDNLVLGDSNSYDGFFSDGRLLVGSHAVTIHSKNQASLGSLTTLAGGTLSVANGLSLDFAHSIVGNGVVESPNLLAKATIINGSVYANDGKLTLTGFIKGVGTYSGSVSFAGTYSPGLSPASVNLEYLSLTPSSTLLMEVGGLSAGSQYDVLNLSEAGMLDGTLELDLINKFVPTLGQTFDIINGTTTGHFSSLLLAPLPNGLRWDTSNLYTTGMISVVPEPSALALLGIGAIGILGYGWRRRKSRISAKPTFDQPQDDAPAILSFPSYVSQANATRKAA